MGAAVATGVGIAFVLKDRHPKLSEDDRILVVGDSFAQGLTPQLRAMAEEAGLPFDSVAVMGTTIRDWAGLVATPQSDALEAALLSFRPTIILVSLGTNDEYAGEDFVAREEDDLYALVERLSGYGEVVWIGLPELPRESSGAEAMIRDTGVPYFPSDNLDLPRAPDGLHPTAAGYGSWAGMLWSWLT